MIKIGSKKQKIFSKFTIFTLFCQIFLFFAFSVFAQENSRMCSFATDLILAIDITQSMQEGAQRSKCEWTERRQVPGQNYFTWYLNTKYDVSQDWCFNVRDSYDETRIYFSPKEPTYTPALPSKIEATKIAFKNFLDNLGSEDQSGLVAFGENANLLIFLSQDHQMTKNAIDGLFPQSASNTDIQGALEKILEEFGSQRARIFALKSAILIADGSDENKEELLAKVQEIQDLGYKIFTIALGKEQDQLRQIAQKTQAQYYFAKEQRELDSILSQISAQICQFSQDCQRIEQPQNCISDGQREYFLTWNYPYCGENTTTSKEDESCLCQYSEWQNQECKSEGLRRQTRTQITNFEYCQDLERTIEDESCFQKTSSSKEENSHSQSNTSGGAVSITTFVPKIIPDSVRVKDIEARKAIIQWQTNFLGTSQVIYSSQKEPPHFDPKNPPNYGYSHFTPENSSKVTFHTVILENLEPETLYYYRALSRGSGVHFSPEFTFKTKKESENKIKEESFSTFGLEKEEKSSQKNLLSKEVQLEQISQKLAQIQEEFDKILAVLPSKILAQIGLKKETLVKEEKREKLPEKILVQKSDKKNPNDKNKEKDLIRVFKEKGLLAAIGLIPLEGKVLLLFLILSLLLPLIFEFFLRIKKMKTR